MDTQDPRFIDAYNDLTASFFRFMNVVNPAPSPEAQIQLICQSMQAIVESLRKAGNMPAGSPAPVPVTGGYTAPTPQPVTEQPQPRPRPVEPEAAPAAWEEKRYAPVPVITSEDIYKFMFKQLKREEAFEPNDFSDQLDKNDYPFVLEFTGTEGIFTLNGDTLMSQIRAKEVPADIVRVEGVVTGDSQLTVKTPGSVEKSTGGWKVTKPIIILAK